MKSITPWVFLPAWPINSVRQNLLLASSIVLLMTLTACKSKSDSERSDRQNEGVESTSSVDLSDEQRTSGVALLNTLSSSTNKKAASTKVFWTETEVALLKTLSIRNLPDKPQDPSNQFLHNPAAIEFGQQLFFDPGLSQTGTVSCSTCHQPQRHFSDGMRVASGIRPGTRNTPSLLGVAYQQWFFWDGRKDSVWAQALEPFENPNEHNLSRVSVIKKVLADPSYHAQYLEIFGTPPSAEALEAWPDAASPNGDLGNLKRWKSLPIESRKQINRIYSNIGKAIAAFEATLTFPASKFDDFLDQLSKNEALTALSEKEQLGLKVFAGKASCISCHHSALLSNQHFQNIGTGVKGKDLGRAQVAEAQAWDEFNCLGEFSDAPEEACKNLKFMSKNRHELAGSFKVPSLRNISKTAPFMHDGRFKTLGEVVNFYLNPPSRKRTDHHLPDIDLDEQEIAQLIAFLNAL